MENWTPDRFDRAIELLDAERRSHKDIATELNISVSEVRRRLTVGRRERAAEKAAQRRRDRPAPPPPGRSQAPKDGAVSTRAKRPRVIKAPTCEPLPFSEATSSGERRCLFPVDETTGHEMNCCGAPVADPEATVGSARSYCWYHLDIASGDGSASERAAVRALAREMA